VVVIIRNWLLIFILLVGTVYGQCETPTDGLKIENDVVFCEGTYNMPKGMIVIADDVNIVCDGAAFLGDGDGHAFTLYNVSNIVVSDCEITKYLVGIYSNHSSRLILSGNDIHDNEFAGILLEKTDNSIITDNKLMYNGRSNIYFMTGSLRNSVSSNDLTNNGFYNMVFNDGNIGNSVILNKIHGQNILDANDIDLNFYCVNEQENQYLDGAFGPGCEVQNVTTPTPTEPVFDVVVENQTNVRQLNSVLASCLTACLDKQCERNCDTTANEVRKVLDDALSNNETVLDIESIEGEATPQDVALFIEAIPLDNPVFSFPDKTSMISEIRLRYDNASDLLSIKKTLITVEDEQGEEYTDIVVNIFPTEELVNLTIMEFIPKSTLSSAEDIIVVEVIPYAEMIVLNDDPLVVWSFSEVREDVTIRYRVDKVEEPPKTLSVAEKKKDKPEVSEPVVEPLPEIPLEEEGSNLMAYGMLALIPVIVGGVIYFSRYKR